LTCATIVLHPALRAKNVRRQVTRLKSSSPVVQKLYRDKKIDIVGGVYDLASGKITLV
jgi:carbonic anhydrase